MKYAALAYKFETQYAIATYRQMIVLQSRDAVGTIPPHAALGADTEVKRIDQPDHDREHLFAREAVEHDVLVRHLAQPRQVLAESLDLCEFAALLSCGEHRMITILNAPRRIDADRLYTS